MDDAGTVIALKRPQVSEPAVGNEGVREGVINVARTRMTDEARLLGEHDEVLILIPNVEVDVRVGREASLGHEWLGVVNRGAHPVSEKDLLALRGRWRVIDGDQALLHEF